MTTSQIKAKLIELGVPAGFINVDETSVSVDYDTLELKYSKKLLAFVKSCEVQHSDKCLFILAK